MAEAGRRTVVIRGQVVDRYSPRRSMVEVSPAERRPRAEAGASGYRSRRPSLESGYEPRPSLESGYEPRYASARSRDGARRRRPYDPPRARPDRIAMWAVLLGVVLLLAAATSSHAAMLLHAVAR
jgi:hypothetical protein